MTMGVAILKLRQQNIQKLKADKHSKQQLQL